MHEERPTLSICTTCRDGREDASKFRGGMRLAKGVLAHIEDQSSMALKLRGVRCMSQCNRPCVASLTAQGKFTYVFGDLDPERPEHIDALLELASQYSVVPEGFLERSERPEPLRSNILGRLPPVNSMSSLITNLEAEPVA